MGVENERPAPGGIWLRGAFIRSWECWAMELTAWDVVSTTEGPCHRQASDHTYLCVWRPGIGAGNLGMKRDRNEWCCRISLRPGVSIPMKTLLVPASRSLSHILGFLKTGIPGRTVARSWEGEGSMGI